MDEIAKSIERKFELGLSDQQSKNIDSIFQEFMREYHFPKSHPFNDKLLRFKYFRKALLVLTPYQLNIYRSKKLEAKSKSVNREKENEERKLKHLKEEYKNVGLSLEQLQLVFETKKSFGKHIVKLENQHTEILNALGSSIDSSQRDELDKLFTYQLKRNRRRKAESTKRKYSYLNLRDDQAKEISILDELEKKRNKENNYKGYNPYLINQEFKEILTIKQFELYSVHQEELKDKSLQSQIKEDSSKSDKILELKAWAKFQIENSLPVKCKIAMQLIKSANKNDIEKINNLKKKYNETIEEQILLKKERHQEKYGAQLPNHLKLRVTELTLLDINPSPSLIKDLDLNKNIFSSIRLNERQEEELVDLRLKLREYNIKKLEKKLKGSYASLTTIGRTREIPKYLELYSILLLDEKVHNNINQMKMRQITHGITP